MCASANTCQLIEIQNRYTVKSDPWFVISINQVSVLYNKQILRYVNVHMYVVISIVNITVRTTINSDINFRLNPASKKRLVLNWKIKCFHGNVNLPLGVSNINNHWSIPFLIVYEWIMIIFTIATFVVEIETQCLKSLY